MTKLFTLSMALMLAGFYTAAQINIPAQERFNPQKSSLSPQKQIAGQDW